MADSHTQRSAPEALRVLLVGNMLSSTVGVRTASEELAEQMSHHGWRVAVTSDLSSKPIRLLDMVSTVIRRRSEYDCAQVAVFSGSAFIWAEAVCAALKLMRKPYILTLHGGNLPVFASAYPGRVRRLLSDARQVTAPSQFLIQQMRPFRQDIHHVPNGVNLKNYPARDRERLQPRLVWLRAFHRIYNAPLAPKVLAELASDFPDVGLTMIGPDKDGSLLTVQQEARSLGVADRIAFTGPIDKPTIGQRLSTADIFLNTTNVDNAPVSVIEAMATGLCVVSTNVGGIQHMLEHEKTALLVPPDDPKAMAAAVRRLLREPELAASISRNARIVACRHDWPIVLSRWEQMFTAATRPPEPLMLVAEPRT